MNGCMAKLKGWLLFAPGRPTRATKRIQYSCQPALCSALWCFRQRRQPPSASTWRDSLSETEGGVRLVYDFTHLSRKHIKGKGIAEVLFCGCFFFFHRFPPFTVVAGTSTPTAFPSMRRASAHCNSSDFLKCSLEPNFWNGTVPALVSL